MIHSALPRSLTTERPQQSVTGACSYRLTPLLPVVHPKCAVSQGPIAVQAEAHQPAQFQCRPHSVRAPILERPL
jgi:hypothetical protein